MEEIAVLLDQLESKLKAAKRLPGDVMPIIDQIRGALEDEARAEGQLAAERDRTIALARQEAESIVAKASEEAQRLAAEQAIVQAAKAQAQAMQQEASAQADGIRSGADEYAFEVLCQLEQELSRTLTVIANGLRTLQDKRAGTAAEGSPSEDRQDAADSRSPVD